MLVFVERPFVCGAGEDSDFAGCFERVREVGEERVHGVRQTHGSKNTGSKQGIAAKVEQDVFRAGDVGVNP